MQTTQSALFAPALHGRIQGPDLVELAVPISQPENATIV